MLKAIKGHVLCKQVKLFLLFTVAAFIIILIPNHTYSQLIINSVVKSQADANNLVNKVLKGNGVSISNVIYRPLDTIFAGQIGQFSTGSNSTNLGITDGIVMSTGDVRNSGHANDTGRANVCWQCKCEQKYGFDSSYYCQNREISLEILQGCKNGDYCSYDAAMLQFDFVPSSSPISFNYVFASDEYPTWVCSDYNDKFAFLVTSLSNDGLNYKYKNIALIPGTKLLVEINSVNSGHPGNGDSAQCTSLIYSKYYVDNIGGKSIIYNGFTTVFAATIDVVPCMSYRLRMAIADINDAFVDSGVFLQANSLTGNSFAKVSYQHPEVDSTQMVRDCNDAIVTFKFAKPVTNDSLIHFSLKGGKYNTDFTTNPLFPDTSCFITIKAKQKTTMFIIHALKGGSAKSLKITVITGCGAVPPVVINIRDIPPINVTASADTSICKGDKAFISVNARSGLGKYTYRWSSHPSGFSSDLPAPGLVSPQDTTIYTAIVTDGCSVDSAKIKVDVFNAAVKGSAVICKGGNTTLKAGIGNGLSYQWYYEGKIINGATDKTLSIDSAGTYYVIESSDILKCTQASDTIKVKIVPLPEAELIPKKKDTTIAVDKSVVLKANTGKGYTYQWLKNNNKIEGATESMYTVTEEGTYSLLVTDSNQCTDVSDTIDVKLMQPFINKIANIMIAGKNDCNGYFRMEGGSLGLVEVAIYNRWGQKVFYKKYDFKTYTDDGLCKNAASQNATSQTRYYNLWDGKDNSGHKVSAGAYFFVLKASDLKGNSMTPKEGKLNGTITLIN